MVVEKVSREGLEFNLATPAPNSRRNHLQTTPEGGVAPSTTCAARFARLNFTVVPLSCISLVQPPQRTEISTAEHRSRVIARTLLEQQ